MQMKSRTRASEQNARSQNREARAKFNSPLSREPN